MKTKEEFLTADIRKMILFHAIPALGGIILLVIDSFFDGLLLSRLIGQQALAGLTLASPLLIFQSALGSLVASGASILISKAIGRGDQKTIQHVFFNLHLLAFAFSIIAYVFYLIFGDSILHLLSQDETQIRYAHAFYHTFCLGTPIIILALSYGALLRSSGAFKKISLYLFISLVINIVFSWLLIPILGMSGCALGTLMSLIVYATLNFIQISRNYDLHFTSGIHVHTIRDIFNVGLSSFLFQLSSILRQALIIKFIQLQFNNDVSVYGALSRMLSLLVIPAQALIQSFQPLYITNLGADLKARCLRAIKFTTLYGLCISVCLCLLTAFFAADILSYFLNSKQLPPAALQAFYICLGLAVFYPVSALNYVLLQSSGHHHYATVIACTRELVLLLPLLLLFRNITTINTTYWAILAEVVVYTFLIYGVVHYKIKQHLHLKLDY